MAAGYYFLVLFHCAAAMYGGAIQKPHQCLVGDNRGRTSSMNYEYFPEKPIIDLVVGTSDICVSDAFRHLGV